MNSSPELVLPASTFRHRTSSQKSRFPFLSGLYSCCFLSHSTDPQVYPSQFSRFLPHCHSPSFPRFCRHWEHFLYLQPGTCLAAPYPTQTLLLLCPAPVHLSALPPLPLTARVCFLGFFSILSLAYWKLCASCSVPDICTFLLQVLQNLCWQLNSSPTDLLLEQPKVGMLLGSPAGSRVGGQPGVPAQTVLLQCPPHPCTSKS